MALIICQECGKEISDKATACIHCGCPIEEQSKTKSAPTSDESTNSTHDKTQYNIIALNRAQRMNRSSWNITIKESAFTSGDYIDLFNEKQFFIGERRINEVSNLSDKSILSIWADDNMNISAISYIIKSTTETAKRDETRVRKVDETIFLRTTDEIRCPKCGSNQIQLVQRKWSALTGIFTNKVDRVCMHCKKKF